MNKNVKAQKPVILNPGANSLKSYPILASPDTTKKKTAEKKAK